MNLSWLKHYMPRSLYGRAALILLLPVVFLQLVISVVFTQRHFEDVTNQMSDTVARELRLVLDGAEEFAGTTDAFARIERNLAALEVSIAPAPSEKLEQADARIWYDFSGAVIFLRLRARVPEIGSIDLTGNRIVSVFAQSALGPIEMRFDRRRLSASNPHQLFVIMVFFSVLITAVAFIYLRNQLRPIKRLASAAEAFGKGRHMPYSPSGATEVRAAGTAFVDMRNRIERQIETRTQMLSGVSHDLRTPLTRLRLGLSLLDDEDRQPLERDVDDMARMIDEFLNFAKGSSEGEPEPIDPVALTEELVSDAARAGQNVTMKEVSGSGEVMLRKHAIRRALGNLISNAVRYGERAEVSVTLSDRSLRFRVEDDGPGIPEDQREEAQKPFSRLDPARNQDRGGSVGLGLAIARDIARAHGGVLRLGQSERLGGLRADIVIAR